MTEIGMNPEREGFSLIEMIIAIAIAAIVMSSVLLLMTYSSSSMNRTNSAVTVQNQAKDAVMHVTTYLQEGSEAGIATVSGTDQALIVINEKKDKNGEVVSAEVGYYWYDSGDHAMYFYKDDFKNVSQRYKGDNSTEPYPVKNDAGEVDFGDLAINYSAIKNDSRVFVKNCIGFACTQESGEFHPKATPTPDPSVTTTPAPAPVLERDRVGEDAFTVSIMLKSESGDAEFSSTKTVYMRNQ